MIKFKKHYNLKIILVVISIVFCLNTSVYGLDIHVKSHLRPRLLFDKDNIKTKSLADILIAPDVPVELTERAISILREEKKVLEFLGVKRSQIKSIRYEIERNEESTWGYVLKFILHTESGEITFYAKLRRSDLAGNPTELEYKMTLASSQASSSPSSTIIADTLLIRGIDNGISLEDISGSTEWRDFFSENEEYFVKEIGRTYGRLNKIAGIIHVDVQHKHIFITKDKTVYLIDFSTQGSMGKISRRITSADEKIDINWITKGIKARGIRVEGILSNLLDAIYEQTPIIPKENQVDHKKAYIQWFQEGYDEIKKAETPLIDLIDDQLSALEATNANL